MKRNFLQDIAVITTIALILSSLAYNSIPPANSATSDTESEWQLTVTGLVENPLNLNGTEIEAMPKSTVNAAIICVDFPGEIVMQGNWTGIKLRTLLEEAQPSADVIKVGFYADDGYSTDLTIETAMRDDVIVAYKKDGEPLNDLRLVVPGKWGYKWISQLTRIELVDYDFLGFWESAGYSDEADISSGTQILPPRVDVYQYPSPIPPTTSPSPSPSQPPSASPAPSQSTPKPTAPKGLSLPIEVVYAIAASVATVIVVFGVIVVRKRAK